VLITLISAAVAVGVSLATAAPDYQRIGGLTYATATADHHTETRASWDWRDVAGSAFVLAAILGAYLYFRG
jgi:SSS family solute:Na+ symporter